MGNSKTDKGTAVSAMLKRREIKEGTVTVMAGMNTFENEYGN